MKKITIVISSNDELLVKDFNKKIEDPINLFVRGIASIVNFSYIDILQQEELHAYDLFIIEDNLDNIITYLDILQDAQLIENVIVTTKPDTTLMVFEILRQKKILKNLAAIFLDFDLGASTIHSKNETNASMIYEMIDNKFIHGKYDSRIIAITAFEAEEAKYGTLKQKMRVNGDFVFNKRILRDDESQSDLKTILKSVEGFYWREGFNKNGNNKKENILMDVSEYEKDRPTPNGVDNVYKLLNNIENVLPSDAKFEISKHGTDISKPNSDEKYSSYIALGDAIERSAKKIVWILNHPDNRDKYPKFRKQFRKYSVFKTQINKGIKK